MLDKIHRCTKKSQSVYSFGGTRGFTVLHNLTVALFVRNIRDADHLKLYAAIRGGTITPAKNKPNRSWVSGVRCWSFPKCSLWVTTSVKETKAVGSMCRCLKRL